jgi:hypothetical protein
LSFTIQFTSAGCLNYSGRTPLRRAGRSSPCSWNHSKACRTLPSSATFSKTSVIAGAKFTILVGQNNAGKTSFLEALNTRHFKSIPFNSLNRFRTEYPQYRVLNRP